MPKQKQQLLLGLVKRKGVIKSNDLQKLDIPRTYLSRLVKSGVLKKASRGIYVLLDGDVTEHQSTLEACTRVPHGIVCLLSALQFHGLTTEIPHQIWLGISPKARLPGRLSANKVRALFRASPNCRCYRTFDTWSKI